MEWVWWWRTGESVWKRADMVQHRDEKEQKHVDRVAKPSIRVNFFPSFIYTIEMGYPRDAPTTVLFGEWFRFGKPGDQVEFQFQLIWEEKIEPGGFFSDRFHSVESSARLQIGNVKLKLET
ncbi:hypothetical protein LXL04_008922 [Taraxacum kok-saghyz]